MEEELLSGPVAPEATSEKMLQILSGLAPRDPAAANPATTAAMARSRDAITRTLQRQMARQEEPFSGINDVATAAITALASRHKTPFGSALAKLDADRDNSTIRTASALGQQAQRESKTGIDPIKAANLVMRHIEQQARNGDRDAREVDAFVKTLSSNMEPASALRFQTSYGKAIAEYVAQTGRNPEPSEIKTLISDYAARGGFQPRQHNLQMMINPVTGEKEFFDPRTGATGQDVVRSRPAMGAQPQPAAPGAAPQLNRYSTTNAPPQPPLTPQEGAVAGAPILPPPRGQATQAPVQQPGRVPLPPPAQNMPPVIAKTAIQSLPEISNRLDMIIRARNTAKDVPNALGFQGAMIDNIGGLAQQLERAIGAPGVVTNKYNVNEVSQARDQLNLLFAKLIPTITGDSSGRYSNFDIQLAQKMARFRSSMSSFEQAMGFLSLVRDAEVRSLRRQLVLSGPAGRSIYDTFSPDVKEALENPAVVGEGGDAPYDDIKLMGTKVYVRMKGSNQWAEVQR